MVGCGAACDASSVAGDPDSVGQVTLAVCSNVTITASPRVVSQSDPIDLVATAGCAVGESPQYRFLHRPPGATKFAPIRGWGGATFTWSTVGQPDGGHQLKAQARVQGSGGAAESADNVLVAIGATCYQVTSFSVAPAGSATVGDAVTLTATAECTPGEVAEYQFLLRTVSSGATVLLRSWGAPSFQWDTSGTPPADYELVTQVRAVGNASLKETSKREFFTLVDLPPCVLDTASLSCILN